MVIWGGFIFVKKKQQSEKGFFYKLLLSLQIFFWPFVTLGFIPIYIQYFEIYSRLYSANLYYQIYHYLNIPLVIYGAYTGVKMLKVTKRTKKAMRLTLILNVLFVLGDPKIYTSPSFELSFYLGKFIFATFFFCCYQFVRSVKSDESTSENIEMQKI